MIIHRTSRILLKIKSISLVCKIAIYFKFKTKSKNVIGLYQAVRNIIIPDT